VDVDGVRPIVVGHLDSALVQLGEEDDIVGQAKAMDQPGLEIRGLVLGIVEDGGDQATPRIRLAALKKTRSPAAWKSIRSGVRLRLLGPMYRSTVFSSLSPLE
jgi:hypothetical protein